MNTGTLKTAIRSAFALVLPLVALVACATTELQGEGRFHDLSWIQPGVTTRKDVIKRLGEPQLSMQLLTEEVVQYRQERAGVRPSTTPYLMPTPHGFATVTPNAPAPGAADDPSAFYGESPIPARPLWIRFNTQGLVIAYGFGEPGPTQSAPQ